MTNEALREEIARLEAERDEAWAALSIVRLERDAFERCLLAIARIADPEHEHDTWLAPVEALLARADRAERVIAEVRAQEAQLREVASRLAHSPAQAASVTREADALRDALAEAERRAGGA